jgi:hypothetical protein
MTWLRMAWVRLLAVVRGASRERELDAEIRTHLELLTSEYVGRGMSLVDARVAARRAFGNVAGVRDRYRDQYRFALLDALKQDARFGIRLLAKDPRFAVGAVLALALGISVNNMVFTFVNAALLRDLPLAKPEQLVELDTRDANGRIAGVSYPDLRDWITVAPALFSDVVATVGRDMNVSDDNRAPDRFRGALAASEC